MKTSVSKPQLKSGSETPRVGPLIRNLRRRQDRTLQQLGQDTGLSVGFLSQVEREIATPSLSALGSIARALDVEIEYFIASPASDSILTRAGEREIYWVDKDFMTYERLSTEFPGSLLSAYIVTMPPQFVSEPASHDGEEFVQQLEGRTVLEIDGESYTLNTGDTMHFRSTRTHRWFNSTDQISRVSWVGTSQILRRHSLPKVTADE